MVVRKVAVTGGIACGKTTVCQMFRDLGAHVVSADQIVHQLLENDSQVKSEVVSLLGDFVLEKGNISRDRIATLVFQDVEKLKALEKLLHPRVYARIDEEFEKSSSSLFIADIPLLFETRGEDRFDSSIVVLSDESVAKKRNPTMVERSKFQMPVKEKAFKATYLIYNNGTFNELQSEVEKIYQHLQGEQ
jgi:dephospho-CoA kinase